MTLQEVEELACLKFKTDLFLQTFCHTAAYPRASDLEKWKRCLPLSLLGIGCGMILVQYAPERLLTILFAGTLVFFGFQSLAGRDSAPSCLPKWAYPFLAGISSVMVHAAGVFYFRYCRLNNMDRVTTVATMAGLHFTLNIFKALFFLGTSLIDTQYLLYLIPAYFLSVIGTRLGRSILKNYVSERLFVRGVSFLLITLAIRMVWVVYHPIVV